MTDSLLRHSSSIKSQPQPWLQSAAFDLLYIAAPAFLTSLVVLACKDQMENMKTLPLWAWVSFVLLIDVAHVYATLFRTYFAPQALKKNRTLLTVVPLSCWAVGCIFYTINGLLFWRILAYLAVFHFIRQQYGFVALYSRKDSPEARKFRALDVACIYLSTLYPLLFWHTNLPRNFNWFIEGDFIESVPQLAANISLVAYVIVAIVYLLKELFLLKTNGFLNIPKNLIVFGTALSWWVAIVSVNSDMSFTIVNVISHGVPYMALVWLYHQNKRPIGLASASANSNYSGEPERTEHNFELAIRLIMTFAPAFFLFLCLSAYLEEGFWAGLIWREHLDLFRPFSILPVVTDKSYLAILVPLLSLPQSTHYVLDGFIWRVKDRASTWSA